MATAKKGSNYFLSLQCIITVSHTETVETSAGVSLKWSTTFPVALCNHQFKSKHPHNFSFQTLNPPTRGKHLYGSFIEMMSIWKQMDRQEEGEIQIQLIGAMNPISHVHRAVCYTL